MRKVDLPPDYYAGFETGGVGVADLGLMHSVLGSMTIPKSVEQTLQSAPSVDYLVLGSATTRNISNMALIDERLRPGMGDKDTVTIIDINGYPMEGHQRLWRAVKDVVNNSPAGQEPMLLYPNFGFCQADMTQLPFADSSFHAVVSDYTLNFLPTLEDVDKTFAETSRVLRAGGIMLLSVCGREGVDPTAPRDELDPALMQSPRVRGRLHGLSTMEFPAQAYFGAAEDNGLQVVRARMSANTAQCAILQKA